MIQEPNIHQIAAEFIAIQLDSVIDALVSRHKKRRAEAKARVRGGYMEYLTAVLKRYSVTKSFFFREEPVSLYSFYVPLSVSHQAGFLTLSQAGLRDVLHESRYTILTGTAGSGKSMFMQHLTIDSVRDSVAIPVFIQLRDLDESDNSLANAIAHILDTHGAPCQEEQVRIVLDEGMLVLLLDGFDEVATSNQEKLANQIAALCEKHPKTPIVVSSRPDSRFGGWPEFSIARLKGLSLEEACTLTQRLPILDDLRRRFVEDLQSGLFEKHEAFLSNPLLLSMMVLTYGEYAQVPAKLATFYSQAYETLFQRHDVLKRGYKRERRTSLDMQEFARVFSAFSLHMYDRGQTRFTRMNALQCISSSAVLAQVVVDPEAFLDDCLQAVCLLLEDGQEIAYAHRSFQEYFTAVYVANARPEIQTALIRKYQDRANDDDVFRLLYQHRPEILDESYVLPLLESLRCQIGADESSAIDIATYSKYLAAIGVIEIQLHRDGAAGVAYRGDRAFREMIDELVAFMVDTVWPRLEVAPPTRKWSALYELARQSGSEPDNELTIKIQIPELTMNSPQMKVLFDFDGASFGGGFLKLLVDTEGALRTRVKESEVALREILGT